MAKKANKKPRKKIDNLRQFSDKSSQAKAPSEDPAKAAAEALSKALSVYKPREHKREYKAVSLFLQDQELVQSPSDRLDRMIEEEPHIHMVNIFFQAYQDGVFDQSRPLNIKLKHILDKGILLYSELMNLFGEQKDQALDISDEIFQGRMYGSDGVDKLLDIFPLPCPVVSQLNLEQQVVSIKDKLMLLRVVNLVRGKKGRFISILKRALHDEVTLEDLENSERLSSFITYLFSLCLSLSIAFYLQGIFRGHKLFASRDEAREFVLSLEDMLQYHKLSAQEKDKAFTELGLDQLYGSPDEVGLRLQDIKTYGQCATMLKEYYHFCLTVDQRFLKSMHTLSQDKDCSLDKVDELVAQFSQAILELAPLCHDDKLTASTQELQKLKGKYTGESNLINKLKFSNIVAKIKSLF